MVLSLHPGSSRWSLSCPPALTGVNSFLGTGYTFTLRNFGSVSGDLLMKGVGMGLGATVRLHYPRFTPLVARGCSLQKTRYSHQNGLSKVEALGTHIPSATGLRLSSGNLNQAGTILTEKYDLVVFVADPVPGCRPNLADHLADGAQALEAHEPGLLLAVVEEHQRRQSTDATRHLGRGALIDVDLDDGDVFVQTVELLGHHLTGFAPRSPEVHQDEAHCRKHLLLEVVVCYVHTQTQSINGV